MAEYTAEEILEVQTEIARLQKEGKPIPEYLAKAYLDIAKGVKNHTEAIENSFKRLGSALLSSTVDPQRGLKKYGGVLDAGNQVVGALSKKSKKYGKLISGTSTALFGLGKVALGAADTLFKNYQDLSSVGATGAEGMTGLLENMHSFSFSLSEMDSYSTMIKGNSDLIARIGGTTNKGLKEMGRVSEELLAGGTDTAFYEMGLSTEAVNEGLMAYNRYQGMLGRVTKMTHDERLKGTSEWIKTQRELSKITGQNVKALEQMALTASNEARFGSFLTLLQDSNPTKAKELTKLNQEVSGLYGDELARGLRDLSTGMIGNSEEALKYQRSFPEAADLLLKGVTDADKILAAQQRDAKRMLPVVAEVNRSNSELAGLYVSVGTLNSVLSDTRSANRRQDAKKEQDIKDKGIKNAAEIAAANRKLALTTDNVVTAGIQPALTAFDSLLKVLESIIPSVGKPPPSIKAAPGIGSLSKKFESGTRGSEAVGYDTTGGTSYGKYQIATKTGTMKKFMDFLETDNPEAYKRLKAAGPADAGKEGAFAKEWQALAREGKLGDSEHRFIKASHYDKAITGLSDPTLQQMIVGSSALQEVMWSTAVQHGAAGAKRIFEKVYRRGISEQDLIKGVYAERATKFGSSTLQVQESVRNRFVEEEQMALRMVTPKPGAATGAVLTGPTSGYQATLHGTEAVVPMSDGNSIKIQSVNHVDLIAENNMKINGQLDRLMALSTAIKNQISVSNKILQYTD